MAKEIKNTNHGAVTLERLAIRDCAERAQEAAVSAKDEARQAAKAWADRAATEMDFPAYLDVLKQAFTEGGVERASDVVVLFEGKTLKCGSHLYRGARFVGMQRPDQRVFRKAA
ncbi:hypothetical protein [Pararhizobium sp.]|uniref:hypothetical protein n=1 Tax=Pararhizobium sp. TaxID=1977563 RepID=UPI003D0BA625